MSAREDALRAVQRKNKRSEWAFNTIIIGIAVLPVLGIVGMIYIALHFLIKFW